MGRPSRVALVVQRYGPEVNGGAEQLARRVARLLAGDLDLTVLTTTALDYRTWANHYPAGEQDVEGVRVVRFPVARERDGAAFDALSRARLRGARTTRRSRGAGWTPRAPTRPGWSAHLRDEGGRYDAVAFVTYLYRTTADAIGLVADRALLVPTLHDEPPARLAIFRGRVRRRARPDLLHRGGARAGARALRRGRRPRPRGRAGASTPPPPSDPAPHGARSASRGPTRSASGGSTSRRGSASSSSTTRATGGPCPDGLDLVLVGRRRRAPSRPPVAAPAGLRRGRRQARRARRRGRRRAAVAVREPVARPARGVVPRAADAGERRLAGAGGPVAPLGRRPLVPRRRRVRRHARPAGARAAPGRRDRPPGPPLRDAESCSWDRVRAVWLDALALAAGPRRSPWAATPDGRRPEHLRARAGALPASPASRSPGCSTPAGAGSASRPSRSGSASWSRCSTRWARSCPDRRAAPVALGDRRRRARARGRAPRSAGRRPGRPAREPRRGAAARPGRRPRCSAAARSPGCLILAPDDRAGLRDHHRRDATTTAGATRPWSTGSRTTRFPRDVAAEPRRAAHASSRGRPIDCDFGFGFEHFAAMLATLLGRAGLRGGQLRRRRRRSRRPSAAGRPLAARPAAAPRPAVGAGLVAVAVASPVAGDPVRRELHDPVREHLPVAVRGRRPFALLRGRARAGGGWSSPPSPAAALIGVYPAMRAVAGAAARRDRAPRARRRRRGRRRRCGASAGPGLARRAGRAAALLAVLAAAVARRPRRSRWSAASRTCSSSTTPPINALAGFLSRRGVRGASSSARRSVFPLSGARRARLAGLRGLSLIVGAAFARRADARGGGWTARRVALARGRRGRPRDVRGDRGALPGRRRAALPGLQGADLGRRGPRRAGRHRPAARSRGSRRRAVRLVGARRASPPSGSRSPADNLRGVGRPRHRVPRRRRRDGPRARRAAAGLDACWSRARRPTPRSFQYRMMAAYFGDRPPELTAVGLGSTASYLTGGGAPEWRPARPWTDVLTAAAPAGRDRPHADLDERHLRAGTRRPSST